MTAANTWGCSGFLTIWGHGGLGGRLGGTFGDVSVYLGSRRLAAGRGTYLLYLNTRPPTTSAKTPAKTQTVTVRHPLTHTISESMDLRIANQEALVCN